MPKPRSVKFNPLRTVRPTPSNGTQRTYFWLTPPCNIKSSTSRPTGLSASAVTIAVSIPKQRRSPRATLYSPPPSHGRQQRVVEMRSSPGSSRNMTSPRLTRSQAHPSFDLILILVMRSRTHGGYTGTLGRLRGIGSALRRKCATSLCQRLQRIDRQPTHCTEQTQGRRHQE